jgi:serine/threonine protein kinase/CRP-like cAMP-binding protein
MGNIASACADEPAIEPDSNDFPVASTRTGGARAEKPRNKVSSGTRQPTDAASGAPAGAPASRDAARASSGPVASHAHARFTVGDPVRDPSTGGILSALEDDFYVSGGAGSILGEGAFGIVRKAKHARSKRMYAIKSVRIEGGSDGVGTEPSASESADASLSADAALKNKQPCVLADVIDEIHLSLSLAHPHVVNVYDFYQTKTTVHVVMEYLRGGSLLDAINEANESLQKRNAGSETLKPPFSETDAAFAARGLLGALEHLHSKNVAHRDVKLENVMFAVRGDYRTVRLVDFGLAMRGKTSRDKMSAQCGSPGYIAPEIVHGKHYTAAVDVWASGCVLFAMLNGRLPFEDEDCDVLKMYRRIADGNHAPFLPEVSAPAKQLCLRMLERDESNRFTASEAKEHEWVLTHVHGAEAVSGDAEKNKVVHNKSRVARFVAAKRASFLDGASASASASASDAKDYWRFGTRSLNAGDVLITRGARAKEVYVIEEGCVEILVEDEACGEELKVAERGVGDVVGEMGVTIEAGGDVDEAKHDERERLIPKMRKNAGQTSGSEKDTLERDSGERLSKSFATLVTLLRVKRVWFGARRRAEVRAVTRTRVTVMTNAQYRRMLSEDYGVDVERKRMLEARAEETTQTVRRASVDVAGASDFFKPAAEPAVSAS